LYGAFAIRLLLFLGRTTARRVSGAAAGRVRLQPVGWAPCRSPEIPGRLPVRRTIRATCILTSLPRALAISPGLVQTANWRPCWRPKQSALFCLICHHSPSSAAASDRRHGRPKRYLPRNGPMERYPTRKSLTGIFRRSLDFV